MHRINASKIRTWLLVAAGSLGIHYLMLLLASFALHGFSLSALWDTAIQRLTTPGDATRYLDIAQNGYVTEGENAINLVFYPLYPLLIRLFGFVTGDLAVAGVIVSQCCYAGASVVLYQLILLDGSRQNAWDGVLLLSLYPFSMFVMGVFSEGLFLLLTLLCLYLLRKQQFLPAGAVGFLAALTRSQGMLLIFPAVYEWITLGLGKKKRPFRPSDLSLLLIPAGFGAYLGINYFLHGNCLKFLEFEAAAPWYQSTKWVGENLAVQYELAHQYSYLALIIYWAQIALFFLGIGVLFLGFRRKIHVSFLLYGGVYLGFSYLSGWMISGGRYMLCCVPLYLILCREDRPMVRRLLLFVSAMLFFAYSLFFIQGYAIM